jgi:hypothetical protein
MPDRLLIIDSDIFVLLSAAELLDRVAELLTVLPANVRRLPALPHQLERGRAFKKNYTDKVRATAIAKCGQVVPLAERPADDERFQRLVDTDNIDEGEALMFALVSEQQHLYLASGDKRSMIALATSGNLADVREAVAGRVVCLEATLRLLVEADGVAKVAAAFASVRDANQTLRVIFSEAAATNEAECLRYIASYFNHLVNQVGAGFLYGS